LRVFDCSLHSRSGWGDYVQAIGNTQIGLDGTSGDL